MIKSVRSLLKRCLPEPVRLVIRVILHYFQRIFRWLIIIWQVRGKTISDQLVIIQSAFASPYFALQNLNVWQDPVLVRDAVVKVSGVGFFALRARTDDLWHVLPWRERAIFNLIKNQLKSGDVFIDSGANIGIYTVLASRIVGSTGKVISVEMMPDTANFLEMHIRMNCLDNVTVVRNALSDVTGKIVIATVPENKYGQATIATNVVRKESETQISVQTRTLDDITHDIVHVRLMKIDLEGAEHVALKGANSLLSRLDAVVYESWSSKRSDLDLVGELLVDAGYQLSQVDGNNWLAQRKSKS